MIYDTFNIKEELTKAEQKELKQLQESIQFSNLMDLDCPNIHALGMSRHVTEKGLQRTTSVKLQYKRNCFFEIVMSDYFGHDFMMLRSIWVKPDARGKGLCRELIQYLKDFCLKKSIGLVVIANPIEMDNFDRLLLDWENFRYTGEIKDRDRMSQLLLEGGMQEFNLAVLEDDFYALMVRCVMHYDGLLPRAFFFNLDTFEDFERMNDKVVEKRFLEIEKKIKENPDVFDEFGRNTRSCW